MKTNCEPIGYDDDVPCKCGHRAHHHANTPNGANTGSCTAVELGDDDVCPCEQMEPAI